MSKKVELNKITEHKILKKKIKKDLSKIGYNHSHFGTMYLVDAILLIYNNDSLITNLNKFIYPTLCKKYNTNITAIKTNIFDAILESYYNCDEQILNNYLHMKLTRKPYTKEIIQAVLDNLE